MTAFSNAKHVVFSGNLLSLSQEKFASHVVEQTLQAAPPKLLDLMCDEIFYCYEPDL